MQQDYYSVLASVIMASAQDNAQLRRTIYELARSKLRQELNWNAEELSHTERAEQLLALETAIEKIEADIAKNSPSLTYSAADGLAAVTPSPVEIIPPVRHLPLSSEPRYEFKAENSAPPRLSVVITRSALPLMAVAMLGIAAYVAVEHAVREEPRSKVEVHEKSHLPNLPIPNIPMPSAYGVYALTNGKLTELEPLSVRIPDRGVAISSTLSTASTTKLASGRIQFVAFRRDLVNKAPEKVMVRVVAQVRPAPTSSRPDAATMGNVGDLWTIRNISYEMKVAPVDGNSAMIVIRPADADFSFPAGRYALVLKGSAYDFSVDGPITDLTQCVEHTEQLNAPVYSQCQNP